MLPPDHAYKLIDFGGGRKLEKIGGLVINRPSPGATCAARGSPLWGEESLFFDENRRSWRVIPSDFQMPNNWVCSIESVRMRLKPTSTGQVGVFPEHWEQWAWLRSLISLKAQEQSLRVLSLFAYTGATTLYLARCGASVTHVDSSRPTVNWARENCELSGMGNAPIRWLVEDAMQYVEREIKRGNQYEGIILDPPTYGHGTKNESWNINRDLPTLLRQCWKLLSVNRAFVLLSGHSPGINLKQLSRTLADEFGAPSVGANTIYQSYLVDEAGRKLDCGYVSRFEF